MNRLFTYFDKDDKSKAKRKVLFILWKYFKNGLRVLENMNCDRNMEQFINLYL